MLYTGIGHSNDLSPAVALEQVVSSCMEQLGGKVAQAGILFTSLLDIDYSPLLNAIHEAFPGIELIGCTTDGESSSFHSFAFDSIVLMVFASDRLTFSSGIGRNVSGDLAGALAQANRQASGKLERGPSLSVILPDGLTTMGLRLENHVRAEFGNGHPVFGAKAGDRFRLRQTFQFHGRDTCSDALPLLHISGPVLYSSAVLSGLNPIGERLTVNRIADNVLSHISGMKAVDFYRRYIGDSMEVITQFPLAIFEEGVERFYLRPPCFLNQEDGSILFNGTFPETSFEVQLTEMGRNSLLEAAHAANREAEEAFPGDSASAGLMFSCCSRRAHLGTRTPVEVSELMRMRGKGFQHIGFYSYGEIAPLTRNGPVCVHNETFVILLLGEE